MAKPAPKKAAGTPKNSPAARGPAKPTARPVPPPAKSKVVAAAPKPKTAASKDTTKNKVPPPAKATTKPVTPAPRSAAPGRAGEAAKTESAAARGAKDQPPPKGRANGIPVRPAEGRRPEAVQRPAEGNGSRPKDAARPQAPSVAPAAATPADGGKPKKVSTGLPQRDLDTFRELLLEKRRELVGDMSSMEREALRTGGGSNLSTLPIHMADMGTDNYEQEFTLGLVEKDRNLLREINNALAKLQNGTFGICEGTGLPISKARLEAQPWARFSIEHARSLEKGHLRR